ncbi:MAG: YdcF family protein [Bryobacter sp.]|nr:YdcF family protein [Bryobacter sp. CoA8 C33]
MFRLKLLGSICLLALVLWLARAPLATAAASYLVNAQAPMPADVILVLGGDTRGERATTGCNLLRQGYASQLWLSGNQIFYGQHESDSALNWLVARGCPASQLRAFHLDVDSTRDEAIAFGHLFRQAGFKRYILVTSNFHTRRAGATFRQTNPSLEAIVVAAAGDPLPLHSWWQHRRHRRTFLTEWLKTVSYWFNL